MDQLITLDPSKTLPSLQEHFSNLTNQLVLPLPLHKVQYRYSQKYSTFEQSIKMINARRETPSYLYFERENPDPEIKTTQIVQSKCSLRGNDIYRARVYNRHKTLIDFCDVNPDITFIIKNPKGHHSNILKFTLTVTPPTNLNGGWDRDEYNSWYSQYHYDHFIKRIRNQYPGVVIAKSLEVSTKKLRGYIHINVIAIFPDHNFPVYQHKSKKRTNSKGKPITTWRLGNYQLKQSIDDLWDPGFVDIRAIENPNDLVEYALKYHIKYFTNQQSKQTQDLTLSTLSLYDKRAFSFPHESLIRGTADFTDTLIDYTVGLEQTTVNSPRVHIIQHNSLKHDFLGFYFDINNEINSDLYYEILDKPPPQLNIFYPYDKNTLDIPTPPARALQKIDDNCRFDKESNTIYHKSAHIKKIKKRKLLGNSKKYTIPRENITHYNTDKQYHKIISKKVKS